MSTVDEFFKNFDTPHRLRGRIRDFPGYFEPTLKAILEPHSFGCDLIEKLVSFGSITEDERHFVFHETTFLSHKNVMDTSVFLLFSSKDFLAEFWFDISEMFPEEKRMLFWKIFFFAEYWLRFIAKDLHCLLLLQQKKFTVCWKEVAHKILWKNIKA